MRQIEILDDVRLRFPQRSAEFDLGLEIGALSVQMAQGDAFITRRISRDAAEQLRPIAEHFRYVLIALPEADGHVAVNLTRRSGRPLLRVV